MEEKKKGGGGSQGDKRRDLMVKKQGKPAVKIAKVWGGGCFNGREGGDPDFMNVAKSNKSLPKNTGPTPKGA